VNARELVLAACAAVNRGEVERGLAMLEEARKNGDGATAGAPEKMRFEPAGGGKSICDDTADREVAEFCELVVATGMLSAPSLAALCRTVLSLMCAGRVSASDAAKRTYDAWVDAIASEHGANAWSELALLGKMLGEFDRRAEAARVLERAVTLAKAQGRDTQTLERDWGLALVQAGEHDRALEVLARLRESFDVRRLIADTLFEMGRYDDARAAFEELATALPDGANKTLALLGAATSAQRGGSEPEARGMLSSLVDALDRTSSLATNEGVRVAEELVSLLLSAEDEGAATIQRTFYEATARALGADDPRTWLEEHNLGVVLRDLRELDAAEAIFRRVLARQDEREGKTSANALRTRRSLVRLLESAERDDEAAALRAEISSLSTSDPPYEPPRVHARFDDARATSS
jgi:tetratricopeptide (TPR) repeat protein